MGLGFLDLAQRRGDEQIAEPGAMLQRFDPLPGLPQEARRRAAAAGSGFGRARPATPAGARPRSSRDRRRGIRAVAAPPLRRRRRGATARSKRRPPQIPNRDRPTRPRRRRRSGRGRSRRHRSSPWAPPPIASDCAVRPLPSSGPVSPAASPRSAARPAPDEASPKARQRCAGAPAAPRGRGPRRGWARMTSMPASCSTRSSRCTSSPSSHRAAQPSVCVLAIQPLRTGLVPQPFVEAGERILRLGQRRGQRAPGHRVGQRVDGGSGVMARRNPALPAFPSAGPRRQRMAEI